MTNLPNIHKKTSKIKKTWKNPISTRDPGRFRTANQKNPNVKQICPYTKKQA